MSIIEQPMTFHDSSRHRIAGILTTPAARTHQIALLCHGFLSGKNSTTNKTLTRILTERGIATFRFDFFGHGDSEGPFERLTTSLAVEQAMAALDLLIAEGYSRIGLAGSSFGGLVSILSAARCAASPPRAPAHAPASPVPLVCLALKCPVVDFAEELELEFGQEGMVEWKASGTIPDITGGPARIKLAYEFFEDCRRHVAYAPAKEIAVPTLIVQGDQDEFVPLHQSRRLFDALQVSKELKILPGADHQFSKAEDFRSMTTLISDWLILYLAESGRRGHGEHHA